MQNFYYSFFIGSNKNTKWIFRDLKICALDPRTAVTIYFFLLNYKLYSKSKFHRRNKYFVPSRYLVESHIREVLEYEMIDTKGKNIISHKYRLINRYHVNMIISEFPKIL